MTREYKHLGFGMLKLIWIILIVILIGLAIYTVEYYEYYVEYLSYKYNPKTPSDYIRVGLEDGRDKSYPRYPDNEYYMSSYNKSAPK